MSRTGNVVIAQGGGPTPVINASLRGVVRQAAADLDGDCNIWGARNGITGVLQDRWIDLKTSAAICGTRLPHRPDPLWAHAARC